MRVLFLPQSFPGPFRYTAARIASEPDSKVLFVTDSSRRDVRIPRVRRILVALPHVAPMPDRAEYEVLRGIRRGNCIGTALMRLKDTGFIPEIVIAHAGQGCSLYAKDIFPQAFHVIYADGFHSQGSTFTLLQQNKNYPTFDFAPDRVRNFFQWNALSECHMAYTSTKWQKSLYPPELSERIEVLHEGIDADFFVPKPNERFVIDELDLSHVEELVTFSGRSLDTQRNFPHFLHALPQILEARPKSHVLVMATAQAKNEHTEHKWLENLHATYNIDSSRIHFINFKPYRDYRRLLQSSSVHVFLSKPFALSSGIFEAMSCGCLVLGPDTSPVREVIAHGQNGFLYNQLDAKNLSSTIITLLEKQKQMAPLRTAARNTVLENYNVRSQTQKTVNFILDTYKEWKSS